jgi:hypothetical protein
LIRGSTLIPTPLFAVPTNRNMSLKVAHAKEP